MALSRDQFGQMAESLSEPDGGYTKSVRTGKDAKAGFMVSLKAGERRFPPEHDVTPTDVEQHVTDNADALSKESHYAGGWNDPETGGKDLDVSRRYESHDRATNAMWAHDQDALYNSHEWHSERNWLGRGAPKGGQLRGRLPQGVSPMTPGGYQRLQKIAKRRSR